MLIVLEGTIKWCEHLNGNQSKDQSKTDIFLENIIRLKQN